MNIDGGRGPFKFYFKERLLFVEEDWSGSDSDAVDYEGCYSGYS